MIRKIIYICLIIIFCQPGFALNIGNEYTPASTLSSPTGQMRPSMACNTTSGICAIAFQLGSESIGSVNPPKIYLAFVSVSGTSISMVDTDGLQINSNSDPQTFPKIAYGGGVWALVYQKFNSSTYMDIAGAIIDDEYNITPFTVNSSANNQVVPDITWDSTNSRFYTVYTTFDTDSYKTVYGKTISTSGTVQSTPTTIYTNTSWSLMSLVIQANDDNLLIWSSEISTGLGHTYRSHGVMTDLNGANLSTIQAADLNNYPSGYDINAYLFKDIIKDSSGNFLVLVNPFDINNSNTWDLAQAIYVSSAGTMPNSNRVHFDNYRGATGIAGGFIDDKYYIVYNSEPTQRAYGYNLDTNLYAAQLDNDGETIDDNRIEVDTATVTISYYPTADVATSSSLLLAYQEDETPYLESSVNMIKVRLLYLEEITPSVNGISLTGAAFE